MTWWCGCEWFWSAFHGGWAKQKMFPLPKLMQFNCLGTSAKIEQQPAKVAAWAPHIENCRRMWRKNVLRALDADLLAFRALNHNATPTCCCRKLSQAASFQVFRAALSIYRKEVVCDFNYIREGLKSSEIHIRAWIANECADVLNVFNGAGSKNCTGEKFSAPMQMRRTTRFNAIGRGRPVAFRYMWQNVVPDRPRQGRVRTV